jgi:predicted ABC-type ATPase
MASEPPHLILIAGPNGAGKSTGAPILLCGFLGVVEFVNENAITAGLSSFQPEKARSMPSYHAEKAGQQALLQHKRAGNPIGIWRDGKVVRVQSARDRSIGRRQLRCAPR